MKSLPITLEYANEQLWLALKRKDAEAVKKWEFIIRAENEYRIKNKHKRRAMDNLALQRKLLNSYKLS